MSYCHNITSFCRELKDLLLFIVVLSVFNTLVLDRYVTPTDSMYPTIERNEFKIGTKYDYGYSSYSLAVLPFVPYVFSPMKFFDGRILDFAKPQRGDIISVYVPEMKVAYTKRIIALPGDEIEIINGSVIINGRQVMYEKIEDYLYMNKKYDQFVETLPNGRSYKIVFNPDLNSVNTSLLAYQMRNMEKMKVPEDSYFLMGDNRDNSADSRMDLGCVKREQILAKLKYIIFSNDMQLIPHDGTWFDAFKSILDIYKIINWLSSIRFHRCFISIE